MDANVLGSVGAALITLLEPHRLMFLFGGVTLGLALGIIPGIGGVAGVAILLPFTFAMDPATAIALLLGLLSAVTIGDPISAIVLGAPGSAASAATTLDGFPMTKRGEAGRALGAAYFSAMLGGLFGALLMGVAIPVIKPAILYVGSPELLAMAVLGLSLVAVLSGRTPLRGLTLACFGVMLAMIGPDTQTATDRWTWDLDYLLDGLPLVPLTLGLFALPELCDLAVSRTCLVGDAAAHKGPASATRKGWGRVFQPGLLEGLRDCFRHWFLILRCSWIGAVIGAVPGISVSVIEWISYGHALKTEKDAAKTFGKGDVRGVIAAESAANSREGGALVPAIVFGVPGSAGMALLLGAFLMHGLVPGPEMLTKHLDLTYAMIWSVALANILGSGLCFLFSGHFAKLATLRYTLILPVVLCFVFVGAFEGQRSWGDLASLFFFGVLGSILKHSKWPRPPLVLGFILGAIVERYMFISIERYGMGWMTRPIVVALFVMAAFAILGPLYQDVRAHGGIRGMLSGFSKPHWRVTNWLHVVMLCAFVFLVSQATEWNFAAKIIPLVVGVAALAFCSLALLNEVFRSTVTTGNPDKIHMDVTGNFEDLSQRTVLLRTVIFFGWLLLFMASMALIGLIPTVPLFIMAYMRLEGRERWRTTAMLATGMTLFVYLVFDRLLLIPWPGSFVGDWIPALKTVIPSM